MRRRLIVIGLLVAAALVVGLLLTVDWGLPGSSPVGGNSALQSGELSALDNPGPAAARGGEPVPAADATVAGDAQAPDAESFKPDDRWHVHGRIELGQDVPAGIDHWLDDLSTLEVTFVPAEGELLECEPDLVKQEFSARYDDDEFGTAPGGTLPSGRWHVRCCVQWQNSDEPRIQGREYAPRVVGRDIDFGAVRIELADLVGEQLLLTGRISHSSGRVLAYSQSHFVAGPKQLSTDVMTNVEGAFFSLVEREDWMTPEALAAGPWKLEPQGSRAAGRQSVNLGAPRMTGPIIDFGEIVVEGALLEVVLKGDFPKLTNAAGGLNISRWDDYDGDHITVRLSGNDESIYLDAFPEPHAVLSCIPEGRWKWTVRNHTGRFFAEPDGVLLVRAGETYRIVVEPEFWGSIPVEVSGEGLRQGSVRLEWDLYSGTGDDRERVGEGGRWYDQDLSVPFVPGMTTEVKVEAAGFETARVDLTEATEVLRLTLTKSDREPCQLEVTVGALPQRLIESKARVGLRWGFGGSATTSYSSNIDSTESRTTYNTGKCEVSLMALDDWGYPGGVLSGPIVLEIVPGETVRGELPPIPEPPYNAPIAGINVRATVGGAPVVLDVPLRMHDGSVREVRLAADVPLGKIGGRPTAITTSAAQYPVAFSLPETAEDFAELSVELEPAVEVVVLADGASWPALWASVVDRSLDKELVCQTDVHQHGVLKLWYPPGRPTLRVGHGESTLFNEEIEVVAGQVTRVEVSSRQPCLTVEVPAADYEPCEDHGFAPELWSLQWRGNDGWRTERGVSSTLTLLAEPGAWRAFPWTGRVGDAIEFEVVAGQAATVRLPEISLPKAGSILLKFDVASLGDSYAEADIRFEQTASLVTEDGVPLYQAGWYTAASIMADGILLEAVPIGVEIALWGRIRTGALAVVLEPLKLTPAAGQQIDVRFHAATDLASEWFRGDMRFVTGVPGLFLSLGSSTVWAGEHEIAVFDEGRLLFTEAINFPGPETGEFEMPETLQASLRAHGLLD